MSTLPLLAFHPLEQTTENADRIARGEIRIRELGGHKRTKLTPEEWQEYEAAKVCHFVTLTHRHSDYVLSDAYFRWCEGAKVPFVRIDRKKKYARIKVDLIHLPGVWLHEDAQRELEELFRREKHPKAPGNCYLNQGILAVCHGIPVESAERVAAQMWAIATSPRKTAEEVTDR